MSEFGIQIESKKRSGALVLVSVPLLVACSTTHTGSFKFTGNGMEAAFKSWRTKAPPQTQATIDALDQDETVLIHIIRGRIVNEESRGTSAGLASNEDSKQQCIMHPDAPGVAGLRNWDVIYDESLQKKRGRELKFLSPIEALLQHEIMGHVVPVLRDPGILKKPKSRHERENYAIEQENLYRRQNGMPLVSWRFASEEKH